MTRNIAALVGVILISTVPAHTADRLEDLARNGQVDTTAPIQASLRIIINAPPTIVWHLLTDIDNWPRWQSAIQTASIEGPVAPGTTFQWKSGMSITSKIAQVDPGRHFTWTGSAMMAHVIHTWTIQPGPAGGTLLETKESMAGSLLTLVYSSKKLEEADQLWLDSLKRQAETQSAPGKKR
jgi:uncharacterized protein YndB with AHSA1/START domain